MSHPNLTETEALRRKNRVAQPTYALSLDVSQEGDLYSGRVAITFQSPKGQPVWLDYQGQTVRSILLNGASLKASAHKKNRISLPGSQLKKGQNTVVVEFESAYDNDGAGLHRAIDPADGNTYLYTVFAPFDTNRVMPCFDQPDLKGTFTLQVKAPQTWEVLGNTPKRHHRDLGTARVHDFEPTPPLSTYLFSVCAGPWACWNDPEARIPSRLFAAQSMADHVDVEELFRLTRQCFDFYEKYFEIDYPFRKYDQVFCPHFNWGAMENVGCVLHSDSMLFRHQPTQQERLDRADTVAHEMAHMWFGNLVTMEWWNDLWLNESFATYMANLCLAEGTEWGEKAWVHFFLDIKTWALWQDGLSSTHPIETPVPDTDTTFVNFDGITYGKGASVLKQLAFTLGPEVFRQGVSQYLKKYAWGNAQRKDFIGCLVEAAGIAVGPWESLWLRTSGTSHLVPKLEVKKGVVTKAWLIQKRGNGDRELHYHNLSVGAYRQVGKGKYQRDEQRVYLSKARTRLPFLEGKKVPAWVDVDTGDDTFARVAFDATSLKTLKAKLSEVKRPLARSRYWSSFWLMVREAQLGPVEFLELCHRHLSQETHAGIVEAVLKNARTAMNMYLPETLRKKWSKKLAKLAWQKVVSKEKDQDLPKVWFQYWMDVASGRELRTKALGLLDGTLLCANLTIGQEKRWGLLFALSADGAPGALKLLEEELKRDGTERGYASAFRAEVAYPDFQSKTKLWNRFLDDSETPLGLLRAGMSAFWMPSQRELLEPFVERYFQDLVKVQKGRAHFFLDAYVPALFPGYFASASLVKRAKKAETTYADGPQSLVRGLKEGIDELERAVKIRKAFGLKP